MDTNLTPLFSESEVVEAVRDLAQKIDRDYRDRPPVMIGVLKGAFVFLADLIRQMEIPIQRIELIRLSSYGASTYSSGRVRVFANVPRHLVADQHVILVEDIVDTGLTTSKAIDCLKQYNPASLKLCSLLNKPDRRQVEINIDYLGLTVPDQFIVGYGIDWDERYRQLPGIFALDDEQPQASRAS